MATQAISANGNSADVLNSLFDKVKPTFESLLGKGQGNELTTSSLASMLQNFNTAIDGMGLVKNIFQGDVPDVLGNLSSLAETFFEKTSAATRQAQEMVQSMDQSPEMAPRLSPGPG